MQKAGLLSSPAPPATLGRRFPQLSQASKLALALALAGTPPRKHGSLSAQDNTPGLQLLTASRKDLRSKGALSKLQGCPRLV